MSRSAQPFHPDNSRRKRWSCCLLTALTTAAMTAGGSARAANYTITVDASKQTAGNPRFWAASVGTGTAALTLRSDLQTHYKIGNREIGFQRVRGHGVLSDGIGIYKGPGSYSWTNFDKYLDGIVLARMRPIMEMSFMPTALGSDATTPDKSPPKDYAAYKQFIQAVVQHCVDRYGAADVGQWYWEIWNEPDYPGFWTKTMTEYYTLYDNAVDAITAVLPNAFVGGPGTTYYGPIGPFLQHTRSANKRVTFVSSHAYPGGGPAAAADAAKLLSDNDSRIGQITAGGYTTAQLKSFNTEWNSSYSGQGGQTGDDLTSMDNHWNVGFILKGIKLLSDKNAGETPPVEIFSYWVLSDVFDESGGPSGSYILGQGGNLPFGRVFGLMTLQGMRKGPFNAFKLLSYLGPKRLMSGGGTGGDGVDAMATMSAAGDEIQILVYDYYATLNTTGTDMVTVTVNNLPSTLAGKSVFVTQFLVDETHSNPYSVWNSQGKPTNPTEAQWQAMKAHQHLELGQPVSKTTLAATYTTSFTINRQAGTLLILGATRPVTGRNAFVEIEAEDYDGQSGATKEDSNDSTTLGQSINMSGGGSAFYNSVDFSDGGAGTVQLRVNAQSAATLTLRADSPTGALIGTCNVSATAGAWATQSCTLMPTTGVHTLYAGAGGALRLNYLKFQPASTSTGTGGTGGTGGGRGGAGGASGGTSAGAGGSSNAGAGGATGGDNAGAAGSVGAGAGGTGTVTGAGGVSGVGSGGSSDTSGAGGSAAGAGNSTGAGGSAAAGVAGNSGSGGAAPASSGGGCGCALGGSSAPSAGPLAFGVIAAVVAIRRRRVGRRPHRSGHPAGR
jgi:xylan 1,4-beta-xylosidase